MGGSETGIAAEQEGQRAGRKVKKKTRTQGDGSVRRPMGRGYESSRMLLDDERGKKKV